MTGVILQLLADADLRAEISAVAWAEIGIPLLHRRVPAPAACITDRVRFGNTPDCQIAGPHGTDLARALKTPESFHRFGDRRLTVVPVSVIKIQIIGFEAAQTLLALALYFCSRQSAGATGIIKRHLGADLHLQPVAARLQPGPNGCFALASQASGKPTGVEVRRVDQGAAMLAEEVEQRERGFAVDSAADEIGAHRQRTNLQVRFSKFDFFQDPLQKR